MTDPTVAARQRSRLVRSIERATAGSLVLVWIRSAPTAAARGDDVFEAAFEESVSGAVADTVSVALGHARLTAITRRFWGIVRASTLYAWLTVEPATDAPVIDLRETRSVGTVVVAIERFVTFLGPNARRSAVVRSAVKWLERVRDAPVRYASLVFLLVVIGTLGIVGSRGVGLVVPIAILIVALLGTQITASWSELADSWPARRLVGVVRPPERPAEPDD